MPKHSDVGVVSGFQEVSPSPLRAVSSLTQLMGGATNHDAKGRVNMNDAVVKGFREGVKLMRHQVAARFWMKDREDTAKENAGGILADDMGLGKTIETLTRIVEGLPRTKDLDSGWSRATLVVCPLSVVSHWSDEIEKYTTGLKVIKHHGASRTSDPKVLGTAHVVITTYGILRSEYENQKKFALFDVPWWRIVLDEAHTIKNHTTKGALACCDLIGMFKWCLTGTPMQNNVYDLYSLIKFLGIKQFSDKKIFDKWIGTPITKGRDDGPALQRLQLVLQSTMLRRRKSDNINGKPLLELPKRAIYTVLCPFDASERKFYNAIENRIEAMIKKLLARSGSQYMCFLVLLLRLRQACDHPALIVDDYNNDPGAVEPKPSEDDDSKEDGADDLADLAHKCSFCTTELTRRNTGKGEWSTHCVDCLPLAMLAQHGNHLPSSAKIRMILKLLKLIDKRSQGEEKTIIFSQFTSMLDLIEPFLSQRGINYLRYDGSMSDRARDLTLQQIRSNRSVRVMLVSTKAGGTGLNLSACNNVILVDPWWNPAVEDQAFDRVHRIGQHRDVYIYKLRVKDTVEDRISLLQCKKRDLTRVALSGDKIKGVRLGTEELLALFRFGGR